MKSYILSIKLFLLISLTGIISIGFCANFTTGTELANKFGVHEIVLSGNGRAVNPFDTVATVTFVPNGAVERSKTVKLFWDGGDSWRARCYVSESGTWSWSSFSSNDSLLNNKNGSFSAASSSLPGMLKKNTRNPRHWMTDNGKTFIHIADTAYRLFSGNSLANDWQEYVEDNASMKVNGMRSMLFGDWDWDLFWETGMGGSKTRPNLSNFQRTDTRLKWILNYYPEMVIQLILFIDGSITIDSTVWRDDFTDVQRKKIMDYIIARFAAYPNKYWEVTNDTMAVNEASQPKTWFWANNVGNYFKDNDPWEHFMAFGHRRDYRYPFANEDWSTYIVAYSAYDIACDLPSWYSYSSYSKHVYNTEDYYEEFYGPPNPQYYYRRMMWSYLLSTASATYGAVYNDVIPYKTPEKNFVGLNSIPYIRDFFENRNIDLAYFSNADNLASQLNAPGPEGNNGPSRPQCTHKNNDEFIVYIPNAKDGEVKDVSIERMTDAEKSRRDAALDENKTPVVRVDLRSSTGTYKFEWYRPRDGISINNSYSISGGAYREFTSPWEGEDAVLWIYKQTSLFTPQNLQILD